MPPLPDRVVVGELVVEVDVDGSGHVPGAERRAAVGHREAPPHVEHDRARVLAAGALLVQSMGELVGGDEDRHVSILPGSTTAKGYVPLAASVNPLDSALGIRLAPGVAEPAR